MWLADGNPEGKITVGWVVGIKVKSHKLRKRDWYPPTSSFLFQLAMQLAHSCGLHLYTSSYQHYHFFLYQRLHKPLVYARILHKWRAAAGLGRMITALFVKNAVFKLLLLIDLFINYAFGDMQKHWNEFKRKKERKKESMVTLPKIKFRLRDLIKLEFIELFSVFQSFVFVNILIFFLNILNLLFIKHII